MDVKSLVLPTAEEAQPIWTKRLGFRKMSTARKHNSRVDYGIDGLPDKILIIILSFLSLQDAVRTSVLSCRWRYLWWLTSGSLDFEINDWKGKKKGYAPMAPTQFENLVDQVLRLHLSPSVDKLIIRYDHRVFHLNPRNAAVCDWLRFAMHKDARVFHLSLMWRLNFPDLQTFLSISRAVKPNKFGLSSLTSLKLCWIKEMSVEIVEYLLSHCQGLEHLCLSAVSLSSVSGAEHLKIHSPSLKSLIIYSCFPMKTLSLSVANLLTFEYGGLCDHIEFVNVPVLSDVTLEGKICSVFFFESDGHSKYSNQLEKLVLRADFTDVGLSSYRMDVCSVNRLPQLQHLKQLELVLEVVDDVSLLYFVLLTKACPLLSMFTVQLNYRFSRDKKERIYSTLRKYRRKNALALLASYRHEHLKVVKMMDFACYRTDYRFALSLLQIAKALEKIIIAPGPGFLGVKRIATVRERVMQLKSNLSPGARLVVL